MPSLRRGNTLPKEEQEGVSWLKQVWRISEKDLRAQCGTEVTLYLAYLRYCAILFGISKIIYS